MCEEQKQILMIADEIDVSILHHKNEGLTLLSLSRMLGYSEFYITRKFSEVTGMKFRDYLRLRILSFAFKEVRGSDKTFLRLLWIAGFHPMRYLRTLMGLR